MARLSMTVAAAAAAVLLAARDADAYAKYALKLPNGDAVPNAPAIGHPDAAGLQGLNDFGKGWNKFGGGWTTAYCQADSDGDGFTNGQELGDPCCTWTPTNTAGLITDGISHPSDKTKTPTNTKLQTKCSTGGGATGGGTSNSTSGGATAGGTTDSSPGTVNAGPSTPADDDEDDEDESETLAPMNSAPRQSAVATALVSVVCSVAAAWLW